MTEIPRVTPRTGRLKKCNTCKLWLPAQDCFQRDRRLADGLRPDCKACRKDRRDALRQGATRARPWHGPSRWGTCKPGRLR